MRSVYRAMEISAPGRLNLVERSTPTPGPDEVLIAVEACGICGADAGDIENADIAARRVPGHEVVGRIVSRGANVGESWGEGRRVGVGRLGGHCSQCAQCRQGRFNLCLNQPVTGASRDGGYAEMMLARASGLVAVPDELDSTEAAPLLCAGIATFSALKKSGAEPGDLVAVFGVGGLGHMAVQYARRMGFKVVAVARGADTRDHAMNLGAHIYVDSGDGDPAEALKALGGASAILTTANAPQITASLVPALAPGGKLIVLAAGKDPLPLTTGPLVRGERAVLGSITGTPYETEKALGFSVLCDVRPWIGTMDLEDAQVAYERMRSGAAKFRMVLTMARGGL